MSAEDEVTACTLVAERGTTFGAAAGIALRDEPAPLWQLLVLAQLLSTRISSDVAVATARELWKAGCSTPAGLLEGGRRHLVVALGRGGYRRYDESTATRLTSNATMLTERWHADVRRLRDEAGGEPAAVARLLREFDGIGPTGAAIFLREVQGVWPSVRPYADALVLRGAEIVGLPQDAARLACLVPDEDMPRLAAALVRVARDRSRRR